MAEDNINARLGNPMKIRGENSHLNAVLLNAADEDGNNLGRNIYSEEFDLGARIRIPSWTNIGDMSAVLRTAINLGEAYFVTDEPHIAVVSKHTRPVVIAKGKTQLEATIKAIAGDLNSPFGGIWGFNNELTGETAEFLNRMVLEGTVAPEYEGKAVDILKKKKNHFLVRTGRVSATDLDVFDYSLQHVASGGTLTQEREPAFDVAREAVVVTGNNGDTDINSLDNKLLDDIDFAGNAALYLSSNLVFYVHNGAIAGLGDGCGARTVAAEKARSMLEKSAYAALSANDKELWEAVLFGTPFTKQDFSGIEMPLRLTAFSDAFFPMLDGFVETSGIDRINGDFGARRVRYQEKEKEITFIPKRNNFNHNYDNGLIPKVVVQPGGSKIGDRVILPIAEEYDVKMVFTMTPEQFRDYQAGEKKVTGRRFFGHIVM